MWKILCLLAALSAVAVLDAKPRAQPWSARPRSPYGRTPYGKYGGKYYGYYRYGRTTSTSNPYRRTTRYPPPPSAVYTPTRRTSAVMGPYGPYVNGRPINGGYNPYRRTTRITRPPPPSAMYATTSRTYNPYRRTSSTARVSIAVDYFSNLPYDIRRRYMKTSKVAPYATTRRTSLAMGPYGPYGGRPYGGYNPYRRTTRITRPPPASAMYATTRRTSVAMRPSGVCSYYGKTYKKGETFFKFCSAKCTCMGGLAACKPVCPPVGPCGGGRKMVGFETKLVAGSKCTCRVPKCVAINGIIVPTRKPIGVCSYNGKTYKKGERFFKGCSAKCTCMGGPVACLPVCPPVAPGCGGGRKMAGYETKPVAGSKCTCRVPKCVVINGIIMPTRTPIASVVMGPYGPYVNGRPINGGYNPYRTSRAVGIASYSSEVISMPPISINIWPASVIPPPPEANAGKCGGIVKVPSKGSKTITSPNYPKNYPRRADCVFTLIGAKGKNLKLQFLDMDIEKNARCFWDFIEIFEGGRNGKNLSKICSKKLRTYKVKGRRATVYFHTDGSVQKKGFKLKVTAE